MNKTYDIAAYIWPAYTGEEPRTRMFWPEGMGEWQSVRSAREKFPGHTWPRAPRWGYVNEADPYVMQMQIDAACDHGVNVFIYDWYWYDRRPFLEGCLNDGFLKAKNRDRMKFYLMWANHDAMTLWDKRLTGRTDTMIWYGGQELSEFKRLARRVIEQYFHLENYYTIGGKPVFMIYDIPKLVEGLGGMEQARAALDWFEEEAIRQGLAGIHLQFVMWSERATNISGVDGGKTVPAGEFSARLGFDSMSHYQFVHFTDIDRSYPDILKDVQAEWACIDAAFDIPYFPHISVGWDNNPRYESFRPGIMRDTTPANIEAGLRMAKAYADAHPDQPPLITINSWNEWTETSYLQPDDLNGYGYLEAIRRVFLQE